MLLKVCSVCSARSSLTTLPVVGSKPPCPDRKIHTPTVSPGEYGPAGTGTLSELIGAFMDGASVDPGRVYEDAVAAVRAIGADGDQLEAVVSGFERPHRCGVDANDIPAAELADLVVESDLSGAADDDVGLLLFTVAMRRRRADARAVPQIGDAKVLGVEVCARETPFDPRRALAQRVLDPL